MNKQGNLRYNEPKFIIHLDRENIHCGYIVTNKGSFSANYFNYNLVPKSG